MNPRSTCLAILSLLVLAIAPARADLGYVGCSTPDEAYSFDLDSYAVGPVINLLPEGNYPYDATISPAGSEVWIPGASGDGVVVIDRATGAVLERIFTDLGEYPVSVAFSDDGALALVSCRDSDWVTRVDAVTYAVIDHLAIPNNYLGPGNIALDPVSKNFYLVEWYDDTLYEIDPTGTSILRQVPMGSSMWQLVVDPAGTYIYIADRGTDQLLVIDQVTLGLANSVALGDDPWGVDVTLDGATIVACCEDSHSVHFIDTATWMVSSVVLGSAQDPRDVDILDDSGYAFVTGGDITGVDPVYVFDIASESIVQTIDIPGANTNVVAVQAQISSGGTGAPAVPGALVKLDLFPNPFNPVTNISYKLSADGDVCIAAFDTQGRRIKELMRGFRTAGDHQFTWDGRDDGGRPLASGLYFVRLETNTESRTVKAMLLK